MQDRILKINVLLLFCLLPSWLFAQDVSESDQAFILLEEPKVDTKTQDLIQKENALLEELQVENAIEEIKGPKNQPRGIEEIDEILKPSMKKVTVPQKEKLPPVVVSEPALMLEKQQGHDISIPVKADPKIANKDPIAFLIEDNTKLRAAPSPDGSVMNTLSRGLRLRIETRLGDWYRISTPDGTRGWIGTHTVRFGKDSQSGPTKTVRIQGYDASLEQDK